uniref:Ancient ubiquitous protein 1 n=1 Tax=Hadrurus spadix TaxID=141984 RepID=A0A1W7RAY6_9SCOR
MSTAGIRLDELFARDRCESGWDELNLVFYFPFGIFLVVVRIIIGFLLCIVANILPRLSSVRCVTLRILYAILGFIIKEEGVHFRDGRAEFLIANHVTVFDHIAIDLVAPCVLSMSWELPEFFKNILGFKKIQRGEGTAIGSFEDSKNAILVFPEGATTNGNKGLLKFVTWPFTSNSYIQPVTVKVYRSAGVNIAPSVIDSTWWSDLFWIFFLPFTTFEIRYLPIMIRRDNQTAEEFSVSVQTVMAQQLDIIPTSFTAHDKMDYAKQLLTTQSSPRHANVPSRTPAPSSQSTNLRIMSHQVKEVLPYVPLNVIEQDLALTDNVSLTITRILEGNVLYVPEPEPNILISSSQPGTSNISPTLNVSNYQLPSTASKTFGKTPKERMLSYQERKAQLIDTARRRYLQKHQPYSPATMF